MPRAREDDPAFPDALAEREREFVRARRRAAAGRPPTDDTTIGAGLSGGGIRSATFALGVFQALARRRLLRKVDYLSTVSGGGYFGAFLGRLFTREPAKSPEEVEGQLAGSSGPVRLLRDNGRYLAPKGSGDLLVAGAALLRNWVAVQAVTLSALVTLFLGVRAVESIGPLRSWMSRLPPPWSAGAAAWIAAALLFLFVVVPIGWSYFVIREAPARAGAAAGSDVALRSTHTWPVALLAGAVFAFLAATHDGLPGRTVTVTLGLAAAIPLLAIVFAARARSAGRRVARGGANAGEPERGAVATCSALRAARSRVTRWLKSWLVAVALLLAAALLAVAGDRVHGHLRESGLAGAAKKVIAAAGGLAGVMAFGKELLLRLGGRPGQERPKLPVALAAYLLGALLVAVILLGAEVASRALCDVEALRERGWLGAGAAAGSWPAAIFAVGLVLTWAVGRSIEFVNLSSHHSLYSQRLTRAYLGASNPARLEGKIALTDVARGDDLDLPGYREAIARAGAPLHVINVTINETYDPKTEVQNQDRKGVPLAVGPAGISVGVRHHALHAAGGLEPVDPRPAAPGAGHRVFPGATRPEPLRLGQWVAISGAAFSTGIGSRTNLGLSLLCGLANVRLGYWWDAGVGDRTAQSGKSDRPAERRLWLALQRAMVRHFPAHAHLFSEFLSRFPGTAWRRWYLSDGGHFENLGGYELLRRRLKHVLLVDAEADPRFQYDGLANLVRMARIDFGATITFLDEAEIAKAVAPTHRALFAKPHPLAPEGWSRAHAALARVDYADGSRGCLLYLKASLTGDEPQDVLTYHGQHEDFPHETTADQFFDQAQWESYRALGEHIAEKAFGDGDVDAGAEAGAKGGAKAETKVPSGPKQAAPAWTPRDLFEGKLPPLPE